MTILSGYFSEHLQELRRRVLISFAAIVLSSCVAYFFSADICRFLIVPLYRAYPELAGLVYTNLTEAFIAYLKISLLVGIVVSLPIVIFEVWMFVSPGLHRHEKKKVSLLVLWGTLLFGGGVLFAYFVVMPQALTFLLSFAGENLEPLPKLDAYLTFMVRSALAFGLSIEIPFLMVMAARTGLVTRHYFTKQRTYFYIAIVVLSFLLAAGDLVATLLLAGPLYVLYEAGILVIRLFSSPA